MKFLWEFLRKRGGLEGKSKSLCCLFFVVSPVSAGVVGGDVCFYADDALIDDLAFGMERKLFPF